MKRSVFLVGSSAVVAIALCGGLHEAAFAQEPAAAVVPAAAEVARLVDSEPLSLENWPVWRQRLLSWIGDKSNRADAAYSAATDFMRGQLDANGELPAPLVDDAFAWYITGRVYLYSDDPGHAQAAEKVYRRSLALDNQFARAHRNLALAILTQDETAGNDERTALAERELAQAHELDPAIDVLGTQAQAALQRRDFAQAEQLYRRALAENPDESNAAGLAMAVVSDRNRGAGRSAAIAPLGEQFPESGHLACLHGLALAIDDDPKGAVREFRRAARLGVDPREVLAPDLVAAVQRAARPGKAAIFVGMLLCLTLFYAVVIAAMAAAGVVLAGATRGTSAQGLLAKRPLEVVAQGQVVRLPGEPLLARVYALSLVLGLVLFYMSLPFVAAGILAVTLALLWLIFQAGRIPIKLVIIIIVVGFSMVWAVIKGLFARPGSGSFGLKKSSHDCPRLFAALEEVASRVDTSPVDEVYIGPGSEIGVHQEGRGPFGVFGTKRRVLTLGLSTIRSLTTDELKSILAHEYAHFSHQDTFFSRFIHSVDLSIDTALGGMGAAGGKINYVNPFFWFLYLYYRAYSLLSAGYSRSREFLADRMACSLYGADVFSRALTKVCTEGPLFEATMYSAVSRLLAEQKALINMYSAFRDYQQQDEGTAERHKMRESLLDEKPSLFSSHPTYRERIDAVQHLPRALRSEGQPAIELFDDPDALERELTEFVTGVIALSHRQAAEMAAVG